MIDLCIKLFVQKQHSDVLQLHVNKYKIFNFTTKYLQNNIYNRVLGHNSSYRFINIIESIQSFSCMVSLFGFMALTQEAWVRLLVYERFCCFFICTFI